MKSIGWRGTEPGPLPCRRSAGVASPVLDIPLFPSTDASSRPESDCAAATVYTLLPPAVSTVGVLRVIDAAANRAREGLRVVEDYVRFILDDGHLTEQLKSLAARPDRYLPKISQSDRLASRETQADVGTQLTTLAEQLADAVERR